MSVRYEWGNLSHPFLGVGYVTDGGCVADHDGPCGEECTVTGGAIVLAFDECTVIEGSTEQLRDLAWKILDLVPILPERP